MGAAESTPGDAPPGWMSGGSRPALCRLRLLCAAPGLFLTCVVCCACTGSCCTNMSKHNATSAADIKPAQPYGMSQRLHHANGARPPVTTVTPDFSRERHRKGSCTLACLLDQSCVREVPVERLSCCVCSTRKIRRDSLC